MSQCLRCMSSIVGRRKEAKYCSQRCSKLYLKAQWRKRTAEHQRAYQREYRKAKNGGNRPLTYPEKKREEECLNCGSISDLQVAHIKPLWAGGNHKHVITLCRKHHYRFDKLLQNFWKQGLKIETELLEAAKRLTSI